MSYLNVTDKERRQLNADRLGKISPSIRQHIAAVLVDMETRGWQPVIDSQVYRTPAQQAKLKAQGYSKVSYSFHNVTDAGGVPASLAADIVDARYGWESPRAYWLQLAACAQNVGLATGIYWGLSLLQRAKIRAAIAKQDWAAKIALGWDTAHVEPTGISIGAAKQGKRPQLPALSPPVAPVRVVLNDDMLAYAVWKEPGYWEVKYGEVAQVLHRDVGPGDVAMSIRDALDRLGYEITNIGDHRKDKQRFYIYAAPK